MNMTNFFTSKFNIIEENNKFIEELDDALPSPGVNPLEGSPM